ncbi:MAG TPA: hypothetical protein VHP37_21350 [Burkholderiales bacterium]|nr:hypothetical protein [Burkholderiales bacterium]
MRQRWHAAAIVMAAGCASPAWAQADITGRYTGNLVVQYQGRDSSIGLTMVIASADNGRVKGVATLGGPCAGDYPFEGFLKGNELGVRSNVKGGRAGDCEFGMRGTIEGNRITGTYGRYPLQLTK